jgi:hypothetical protein
LAHYVVKVVLSEDCVEATVSAEVVSRDGDRQSCYVFPPVATTESPIAREALTAAMDAFLTLF